MRHRRLIYTLLLFIAIFFIAYFTLQLPVISPQTPQAVSDADMTKTDKYENWYSPEAEMYGILIKDADLTATRKKAEKAFLRDLKIDETTACNLNVHVGILYDIDPDKSLEEYSLSFCDGAIDMDTGQPIIQPSGKYLSELRLAQLPQALYVAIAAFLGMAAILLFLWKR